MLKTILDWLMGFLARLGAAEQRVADTKADGDVIQRANEAAKKVEREEGGDAFDPNDRDHRS